MKKLFVSLSFVLASVALVAALAVAVVGSPLSASAYSNNYSYSFTNHAKIANSYAMDTGDAKWTLTSRSCRQGYTMTVAVRRMALLGFDPEVQRLTVPECGGTFETHNMPGKYYLVLTKPYDGFLVQGAGVVRSLKKQR
ncbi:hypothetical protein KSC_083460 [Ktedonobacter sp. SOSP1-52]|uniref:hypothetical protein n=1 Tax=Ktedonobacter sp. SOSP1-52 TaxID=2778366 RepID=UPI0019155E06|nr:hypothetical protein [Ktedonobacter sp. SOSP1-52]GHO69454.1 hypothetical protein KSC_083460 [Ktedonobacter sp. SOSP1-52]